MAHPRGPDPDRILARRALRQVGLSGRLERVASGLDTTYRLTLDSGEVVALRVGGVLPIRRPAAHMAETAWLRTLVGHRHFIVPELVIWPNGRPLIVIEDEAGRPRAVTALRWLKGRRALRWFRPAQAEALGAAAAALHAAGSGFELPEGAWLKSWDPSLMAGGGDLSPLVAVAGSSSADVVRRVEAGVAAAVAELGASGFGVINADLGPHNTVWVGHQPGLVDFNDSGWGHFAFDLARFLRGLAWREGGADLVSAALAGYRAVAALPAGYRDYEALFGAAADLFLARYLAPQVDIRGPSTAERVRRLVGSVGEALARGPW